MDQDARVAVLTERMTRLEAEVGQLRERLLTIEDRIALIRTDLAVLTTRVGIYAAGGALVGGALVSLLMDAVGSYFHIK